MAFDIRILELLASRLCHDLVSPVGAIRNGLELIEEMEDDPNPAFMGEAIKLIDHSSGQADRRLRLFRLAYGVAGREVRGFGEMRAIVAGWLEGTRTAVAWGTGVPADTVTERTGVAKVLLNTIILAEEALTHGGTITVAGQGDGAAGRLTITAAGRPGALNAEAQAALDGTAAPDAVTPRTVHAYVTGRFAQSYGVRLVAQPAGPDTLVFSLVW